MPEYGPITQLAFNTLTDDELLMGKFTSPTEVLDYLQDGNNFKSLSELLKETMNIAGACSSDADNREYSKVLSSLINKQADECNVPIKDRLADRTIQRWINGKSKFIRKREDAIQICFALSLDFNQSTTFLNKAGHHGFNIRDARDAIYIYCLLNKKPLSVALSLERRFMEDDFELVPASNESTTTPNGDTTVLLKNELFGNSSWETGEQFLNTFLLPNKVKFIGYRKSAVKEYYWLKNSAYISVLIQKVVDDEKRFLDNPNRVKDEELTDEELIPTALAFRSALRKFKDDDSSPLFGFNSMLKESMTNIIDVMKSLHKEMQDCKYRDDIATQQLISNLLDDVIGFGVFLKYVLSFIKSKSESVKKEPLEESVLKVPLEKSVLKEFPRADTFRKYERNPGTATQNMSVRKAVILLYYIAYAYDCVNFYSSTDYESFTFEALGFEEFMYGINGVLVNCGFSPLYPANQFDWLILYSVRLFEIDDFEDANEPLFHFNSVLSFYFGDEPTEE